MDKNLSELEEIINEIIKFRDERNWNQYHSGKDLAMCLSIEANELLEIFLWKNEDEINKNKLKHELADVFYAALLLSHKYNLNVRDIIFEKLADNREKYPIEKAKNSNKKYDEFT